MWVSSGAFRLSDRRWFPGLFALFAAVGVTITYRSGATADQIKDLLTVLGPLGALLIFFYQRHHSDAQVFLEKFREFNVRYDAMNEGLAAIVVRVHDGYPIDAKEREQLVDYFNLCAEEFLLWKSGYIDHEVWKSWRAGMSFYCKVPEIRDLWERELAQGSYYGFELPKIAY